MTEQYNINREHTHQYRPTNLSEQVSIDCRQGQIYSAKHETVDLFLAQLEPHTLRYQRNKSASHQSLSLIFYDLNCLY